MAATSRPRKMAGRPGPCVIRRPSAVRNSSIRIIKCGLLINEKGNQVSLKEIKTEVSIKGFIANVESKLEYFNRGPVAVEAEFVFPLDSKTAVYNFEAEINGRHIIAECQEQAEAIETYKDAIDSGHSAMLLSEEENAGDVFKLRLGNLDAHSKAVLTFSYVVELDVEVHGTVRFTLPTVLCPRYTPDNESLNGDDQDTASQNAKTPVLSSPDASTQYGSGKFKMSFSASVSDGYKINKITSQNDDVSVSLEGNKTDAKVSLKESFKHDHDLSFDIQYEDFDKPEIVLEKGIPDKGDFMGSDVLMLNFLPSWSEITQDTAEMKCEFIFVIDRSGSMGGSRMKKAKEALFLMLKSLPMDCYFNIVCFGYTYSVLSKQSQKYNTETLNEALSLQEKMAADMGGTEILKPLQYIYKKKPIKGYSRQIFLFTDGAVSNTQNVVKLIRENASSTRVFTFGIGDGCSTELIRQGASVSQGAATFVKDTERLQTKVMSVLKKSMTKPITDLSVKFDLPSEVQHTMVPADLPCLFQGDKLLLYTVLNGDTKVPYDSSLTLSAVCGDQKISHKVSFDLSKVESSSGSAPLHRLAAKAQLELMEQIEEMGKTPFGGKTDPDASMVTISKAANIVCRHTAFVGVDKESKVKDMLITATYTNSIYRTGVRSLHGSVPIRSSGVRTGGRSVQYPQFSGEDDDDEPALVDRMIDLVTKQTFEGCWELNEDLASILGKSVQELNGVSPVKDTRVWATVLALAYLQVMYSDREPEWQMIEEKASKWLSAQDLESGRKEEELIAEAVSALM